MFNLFSKWFFPIVPAVLLLVCVFWIAGLIKFGTSVVGEPEVTQPAPQVAKVETKEITPAKVKVYEDKAKVNLKLPAKTQASDKQHVIAATRLDNTPRPYTFSAVFDEDTGETATYITEEPLPWIGMRPSGSLSLSYGFRQAEPIARLAVQQDFLQVKALSFGAHGTLDSDGQYFAGFGATYRW